jgi:hypothetical protein
LYFVIIYYEKYPQPLTPAQINRKGSYEDFSRDVYQKIYPWELSRFRHGSSYKIPLTFSKEGLYYIQAYYDKKEFTSPVSFNTEGRTPFSGIVIRVKKGNN